MLLSDVQHTSNNYHDTWWWSKKGEKIKRNHLSRRFFVAFPIFIVGTALPKVGEMFAVDEVAVAYEK